MLRLSGERDLLLKPEPGPLASPTGVGTARPRQPPGCPMVRAGAALWPHDVPVLEEAGCVRAGGSAPYTGRHGVRGGGALLLELQPGHQRAAGGYITGLEGDGVEKTLHGDRGTAVRREAAAGLGAEMLRCSWGAPGELPAPCTAASTEDVGSQCVCVCVCELLLLVVVFGKGRGSVQRNPVWGGGAGGCCHRPRGFGELGKLPLASLKEFLICFCYYS